MWFDPFAQCDSRGDILYKKIGINGCHSNYFQFFCDARKLLLSETFTDVRLESWNKKISHVPAFSRHFSLSHFFTIFRRALILGSLHYGWRTSGDEVALGVDGQDPEAVRVPAERVDRAPLLRAHGLDWWGGIDGVSHHQ